MSENDQQQPGARGQSADFPDRKTLLECLHLVVWCSDGVPRRVVVVWTDPHRERPKYRQEFGVDQLEAAVDFALARHAEHCDFVFVVMVQPSLVSGAPLH